MFFSVSIITCVLLNDFDVKSSVMVCWRSRLYIYTMKEKCPQGVCSGEGEYITHLTCSYGNDLDMYPATTCDCGRKFNSLRGTRIHKARWCEERNSPAGECKSIDGPMSQVYPHSIHEPIADHQRPGDIFCKSRI